MPDTELARIAAIYVECCRDPDTERAPVKATAERPEMPRSRIRDLLTASGRGIAGGSLTEKAIRLLNDRRHRS